MFCLVCKVPKLCLYALGFCALFLKLCLYALGFCALFLKLCLYGLSYFLVLLHLLCIFIYVLHFKMKLHRFDKIKLEYINCLSRIFIIHKALCSVFFLKNLPSKVKLDWYIGIFKNIFLCYIFNKCNVYGSIILHCFYFLNLHLHTFVNDYTEYMFS